jgi:hypothetical protein
VRKIEVGPSAPPMMPMDAASCGREAEQVEGAEGGDEDAELRGRAEQERERPRQQRPEVGERADAEEDQRRQQLGA